MKGKTTAANKAGKNKATTTAPAVETAVETVAETATESTTATEDEPASEVENETVAETATETVTETSNESATETVTETSNESATETVTETSNESATETVTETSNESATETATETVAETTNAPKKREVKAKPAPTTTIAKLPPLSAGKRMTSAGTTRSSAPTYNVGTFAYADLQPDVKTGERKYLEFILNGAYFPTFNGDPASEAPVDTTTKVFTSLEEAQKEGAVLFGIKHNMPDVFGYMQNIQLMKKNAPTTGKVHPEGSTRAGEIVKYHCFITATAENVAKVVANMNNYINCPFRKANNWHVMFETLPEPFKLTIPAAPATLTVSDSIEATETEATETEATEEVEA